MTAVCDEQATGADEYRDAEDDAEHGRPGWQKRRGDDAGDADDEQNAARVAHVFKKVSMRWPVMLKFSNAIFLLQVLFHRFQVFSVLVQAELFTLLR